MSDEYAYIGRRPCGHIRAAVVDDQNRQSWTALHVAEMISSGLAVERVTAEYVRAHGFGRCDECDPPKSKQAALDL